MPPGFRSAVAPVTKRPVDADRFTLLALPAPEPTRSVVVLAGQRAAVALLTNRPELALRFTLFAMLSSLDLSPRWRASFWTPASPVGSSSPPTVIRKPAPGLEGGFVTANPPFVVIGLLLSVSD